MFGLLGKKRKLRKQLEDTLAFIHKRIRIDRDLMTASEIAELHVAADNAGMDIESKPAEELNRDLARLNDVYERICPTPKDHWIRENGEIFLVAVIVAMAFRAYFLQPFRIPTGSMQPTLYGIDKIPRLAMNEDGTYVPPPSLPVQFLERVLFGRKYIFVKCEEPGAMVVEYGNWRGRTGMVPKIRELTSPIPLQRWLFPRSQFMIGEKIYTVPATREQTMEMLAETARRKGDWGEQASFKEGEVVINFEMISGDHLFVDRFSYNFVKPKRGDIFVFETRGIPVNASGQFYIKRCVGLPGETLQIRDDDRLYINGEPVPAAGPFEKIYSKKDGYYGHLNLKRLHEVAADVPRTMDESHLLDANDSYKLPPDGYWAMGDNTRHSRDSRYFGPVPEQNLVGRAFFVYWPFGERWGKPE